MKKYKKTVLLDEEQCLLPITSNTSLFIGSFFSCKIPYV